MLTRLIIFLVRKKLGLGIEETFRFANQRSKLDYYFFEPKQLTKVEFRNPDPLYPHGRAFIPSHVSLNWLLDKNCEIVKINKKVYR